MGITIYGLKNCDTCRKALKYVQSSGAEGSLIDVREQPPGSERLTQWCTMFGRDALVNKRSTTWRSLSDAEKSFTTDAEAVALLTQHPALMKRPVMINGPTSLLGFKAADVDALLK